MSDQLVRECSLCSVAEDADHEMRHLPLYVYGSEGIWVCLPCRIVLTCMAEGIRQAAGRVMLAERKRCMTADKEGGGR